MSETITAIQVFETLPAKIATIPKAFELNKELIQKAIDEVSGLSIASIDDKSGVQKVERAAKMLKKMRTTVEKDRVSQKEEAVKFGRAVDAYAKELTEMIVPVEKEANVKLLEWESQVKEQEMKREREETDRLVRRVKQISDTGAIFDGVNYSLGQEQISYAELKLMSDEAYAALYKNFFDLYEHFEKQRLEAEQAEHEAEETRLREQETERLNLAEQKRLQDEEAERIRAEREQLQKEKDELQQQQVKAIEQRTSVRIMSLESLGMYRHGVEMVLVNSNDNPVVISLNNIETLDSDLWDMFYTNSVKNIAEYKAEIEEEEKRQLALKLRTEAREKQLQELGMKWFYKAGQWIYSTFNFGPITINAHTVLEYADFEFENELVGLKNEIDEITLKQAKFDQQQQQEAERIASEQAAKDEAERQAQLTDKDKLAEYLLQLFVPENPEFQSEVFKKSFDEYKQHFLIGTNILRELIK